MLPWLRLRAGSEADHIDHGVDCNSHIARPWDKAEQLHPTNYVASESIDFLRRRDPTQPFFLYMSFHRPHPPFDPPAWALDQYLSAAMPEVPQGNWMEDYAEHRDDFGVTASVARLRPDIQQRCRAGYFGHMTHIDHQLNRFIEALANYYLKKNTVLCFVSDHGELLGDHDLWHKRLPYEGSARIPMIFEGPGIRAGLVLEQPMELRDIMPTLLDCAGLEVPACVEGKSAFPILRGVKRDGENWREYLHGEHTGFGGSAHYLTDGREKYVWLSWSSREQLFDLRNDPQELHDLGRDPANAARLAVWRERLMKELDGREEGFVKDGKLTVTRDVPAVQRHLLERTRRRT